MPYAGGVTTIKSDASDADCTRENTVQEIDGILHSALYSNVSHTTEWYSTGKHVLFVLNAMPPFCYRAVATMSQKHVTKHFRVAKRTCVQWQLSGSCCDTHAIVGRSVEFILRDNYATAIVHILKVQVTSSSSF